MQSLRNARILARLVLVWFAFTVGVAVASPLFRLQSLSLVCSGSGVMKVLVTGDDAGGGSPPVAGLLDCPLCLHLAAPPPGACAQAPAAPVAAGSPLQPPAVPVPVRSAGPLPGRGPPAHS